MDEDSRVFRGYTAATSATAQRLPYAYGKR